MKKRKIFRFQTLRFQLLFRSLCMLSLLLILIGTIQYVFVKKSAYDNKSMSIQGLISSVSADFWVKSAQSPKDFSMFYPGVTIAFIKQDGELTVLSEDMHSGSPPVLTREYQEVINRNYNPHFTIAENRNGNEELVVLQPIILKGKLEGIVQMSTETDPMKEGIFQQMVFFTIISISALLLGVFTFYPIIKHTLKPLSTIVDLMGEINAGNLNRRLPLYKNQHEIHDLANSFNGMLERIETSFRVEKEAKEQMRRFVSDASHELRTPLTSIHGFLEIMLRGAVTKPEQVERALKSMFEESKRANHLVQDLLFLAKLDRLPGFHMEKGSLASVISSMESQLRLLVKDRKLEFSIETEGEAVFDKDKMKQVILNLCQNAVQHTDPEKGFIKLTLKSEDQNLVLAVEDNGTGIEEKHLPHLFERFYRAEASRSRKYGGAGLGLAITKSIVDAHQGSIEVKSKPGKRTVFQIRMPKENSTS
ncbi:MULTISPECIES: sensor histidine kinase [Bacillus]|uniref:sensor histidine kinase n=1 Tax=Bacillus TaxID=1386 RepID=UPI001581921D|nr:HAMP domain-containing sensor histidine kinase [Bacillus glycinifermentans]NUJ18625.1 HAMP domain-containing protein [Bacillus glycinifermentans]